MPKCPKCDKEVYFAERGATLSMKASPTATTPATRPRSGPKALGGVELRVTPSSEPDGGGSISGCPTKNNSSRLMPALTPRQLGLSCRPPCPQ
ncbi:Cysteine-rich protein 1 [Manis javanica]|nr:Cysteine-rich protein 1 [Manis javanica]